MKRGYALIELLTVISVAAVIFTVVAMAIHSLSRAQTLVQAEANTAAALHELARRFREDAHAAAEFSVSANSADDQEPTNEALTLKFPDGHSVVYDFNPELARVRRRVVQNEQTFRRDTFALPRGCRIVWQAPAEGAAPLLTLVITRPVGQEPQERRATRTTRIEAALGLDRRTFP
jgi:prepilin-type N-terminal cleavage/methylation domain-containing protein